MDVQRKMQDTTFAAKNSYPELENIQSDLSALKSDTAEFGSHVISDGREKLATMADSATDFAKQEYQHLSKIAKTGTLRLEEHIKARPFQSAGAAFLTGFIVSMMLRKH
jgi:ElaB/YqjD/DUF883 family membrane-anchored ribosome-binding protein